MQQTLNPKKFQVKVTVATHYAPKMDTICGVENHDDCDWETILKKGLENMYPDMVVYGRPESEDNIINFSVSITNRSNPNSRDVEKKIDRFIGIDKHLVVKSLTVQ